MTLQDVIRELTFQVSEDLRLTHRQLEDYQARRSAADDRLNRASTEVRVFRTSESERQRTLASMQEKIEDLGRQLDEIERKRSELHERFLEQTQEKAKAKDLLEAAQGDVRQAKSTADAERQTRDECAKEIERFRQETHGHNLRLKDAYARSLDVFLEGLEARVTQAFSGEEERRQKQRVLESMKAARHTDARTADLCDQRDELRRLLSTTGVPAIRDILQLSLTKVEEDLEKLYPGATQVEQLSEDLGVIEELFICKDALGSSRLLLPISLGTWESIAKGSRTPQATAAMRLMWSLLKQSGLTASDGGFAHDGRWCLFCFSPTASELASLLDSFKLDTAGTQALHFRIGPLPQEVQEAMLNEAIDQ